MSMFARTEKPYTESLNGRRGVEPPVELERPRPVIPPPQALDYDTADEFAPPSRRVQHERQILETLADTLSEPTPVERVKQDIRSLTYGEMIEVAEHVAKSLDCATEKVASALHEFGKAA